jgi:methylmalonyl-CoA epimerase|tara:strand:- start:310 stop:717 length:408 start_codon:yes stop_codon:yes gene_type:complete
MKSGSINHIGIATLSLDEAEQIWSTLGFTPTNDQIVEDQGVKIRYMKGSGNTNIELLEPISDDSPIGKFIKNRGVGIQQIAINVGDINSKIVELKNHGFKMINDKAITGSEGKMVAFIHPSSCGGVLVELVENNT